MAITAQPQPKSANPEYDMREFDDVDKTRELIYSGVLSSVAKRFPIEDDEYRLELHNPRYAGPLEFGLEAQKQALMKNRNLQTPLVGTWRLVHKPTNNVVEEREDTVMQVPYYTQRGTFVNNGSEYTVVSQARLRPGVYVRKQRTGEIEGHFNVKPGTGRPFRVQLEPKTGLFKVTVGQSKLPLYPMLKALGATDRQLAQAWGAELLDANSRNIDPRALSGLYSHMAGYNADDSIDDESKSKYLAENLPKFELDEGVVARTLGLQGAKGVTPDVLLRTTAKMLGVSRGEEEPDDRDSPRFSGIMGVEDLIRERIEKDAGKLTKNLMRKIRRAKSLKPVYRNALNPYVDSLMRSSLASPLEETNPLHVLEQLNRVTKLGEGGIGSAEAITDEARDVNPGNLGFADPIAGPENENIGIDFRTAYKTFKGKDGRLYGEFVDRAGETVRVAADDAIDSVVGFPGQDGDVVYAMKDGKMQKVPRKDVDYFVPSFAHMFSPNTNLNPMPTSVQAGRQFYGSKFWTQYMPQVQGDVPLVDSLMPDGKTTFSEYYGRKVGTLQAKRAGTVQKVTDKGITIVDDAGNKQFVETVQNLPFNRLSAISYFPTVKPGDKVNVGDMVAHSNFTDAKTGALNLGRNLKTAVIPFRGASHEDAYVISESAAKKLATERLFGFDADSKHGTVINRNKFMSAFPDKFTKDQFGTLDDDGVVKPGTVLHKGDPIVVAVGPRLLSAADAQLGKLHKVLRNSFTDKSQVWEYDWPGTVVDVAMTAKGAKVNVKSTPPVAVGDKLSTRQGLKGITGKVIPDDKMPRNAVTNEPYDVLLNPMTVLSRVAPNQIMELALGKIAAKTGKQIRIPQIPPAEGWAAWVKKQMDDAGVEESSDLFDPESGKTIKGVGDGVMFVSAFHHLAEKKLSARGGSDAAYNSDEQAAHGGYSGGKKFCFAAHQPIRVFGGEDTIGHIVEKRIPAMVWAAGSDGAWGWHRISNWYSREGSIDEVLNIKVSNLPCESAPGRKRLCFGDKSLYVTKNHVIYRHDGSEVKAQDLIAGDWLASCGYVPTDDQLAILRGSMLGDGAICDLPSEHRFYLEMHSEKQSNYVKWKHEMLGGLVSNRSFTSRKLERVGTFFKKQGAKNVSYLSIHRHDVCDKLYNEFYVAGKKRLVNFDFSNLNELGLAVLFLDDGSAGVYKNKKSPQGNLATMGFLQDDCDRLALRISEIINVRCARQKDGSIYLSSAACERLAELVLKYVPLNAIPKSKRWLVEFVAKRVNDSSYVGVDNRCRLGTVPVKVLDVSQYVPSKPLSSAHIMLYDIEVEDVHRYCASDVLVSNSSMDVMAALSHGGTSVIKDVITIRGTKNEEFWKALKLGRPLPEPGVPFIYDKFLNTLRAGGINVVEKGDITQILPMTDDDVDRLAKGTVDNSDMVDHEFEPRAGGLFDVGRTGGLNGRKWTAIKLPEPIPNPVMEEPIRRLLGLKVSELEDVIAGRKQLEGKTGGEAIKAALEKVDIDKMIELHRDRVRTSRGANRDNSVKILGYLDSAKKNGIHPSKWVISKVPVLPPVFRPVSKMGDVALVADLNELYRDVIESSSAFSELKKDLPDSALDAERLNIYGAVKAAYGLGEPITPEGQSKRLKGAIRQVIGTSPKTGMAQSKVFSKPVDVVGRGVAAPDPNLDMDQVGIPEDAAWDLYKDFTLRNLVMHGYPAVRASEMIEKRTPEARDALDKEMANRPVILDRAPTLHKFNLMGFYPHIAEGNTIRVSPIVCKGFNLDFDGDEQIGKVIVFLDNTLCSLLEDTKVKIEGNKKVENNLLTKLIPLCDTTGMKANLPVPVSQTPGKLFVADLADFPHGDLIAHKDGAKGPIDFYAVLPGTKVIALSSDGTATWADVSGWSVHRDREIEIVNLRDGHQIITDDDPRAVFGVEPKSGSLSFVRDTPTNAFNRGIVVPCVKNTGALYTETMSTVHVTDTDVAFKDLELDSEFGWVIGALVGDGWWDKSDFLYPGKYKNCFAICLADLAGDNAARLEAFIGKLSNWKYYYHRLEMKKENNPSRYGDTVKHTFLFDDSAEFTKFLCTHLGGERDESTAGSANKHLPAFCFAGPADFRKSVVCGLIDTDGSVSVSTANGRKQLMCSLSTTSIRLATDMRLLCRTLGVRATITTTATPMGRPAWVVTLSTADLKRENVLDNLCNPYKRMAYVETTVDTDHVLHDTVVITEDMANRLASGLYIPKQKTEAVHKAHFSAYMTLRKAKENGFVIARNALDNIVSLIREEHNRKMAAADAAIDLLSRIVETDAKLLKDDRLTVLAQMSVLTKEARDRCKGKVRPSEGLEADAAIAKAYVTNSTALKRWEESGVNARGNAYADRVLDWLRALPRPRCVLDDPDVVRYLAFVGDRNVSWSPVESVERTNKVETGYDLTVPGYETFMSAEGVILSNTMNFHVPVSDKAVEQVKEKMLPSKNLFSLTDLKSARYSPTMEMTYGLYKLTDKPSAKPAKVFRTQAEAIAAYRSGEIGVNDPVEILEMK